MARVSSTRSRLALKEGTHLASRFVEWEDNPERKKIASEVLKTKKFTPIPGVHCRYPVGWIPQGLIIALQNFSLSRSRKRTPCLLGTVGRNTMRRSD